MFWRPVPFRVCLALERISWFDACSVYVSVRLYRNAEGGICADLADVCTFHYLIWRFLSSICDGVCEIRPMLGILFIADFMEKCLSVTTSEQLHS